MDRLVRYKAIDELDQGEVTINLDKITSDWRHRAAFKYGDWFYYQDPKTSELYDIHPSLIHAAIIDEKKHEVLGWILQGMWMFESPMIDLPDVDSPTYTLMHLNLAKRDLRIVPAANIVQLTCDQHKISEGHGNHYHDEHRWPFGYSILEDMINENQTV